MPMAAGWWMQVSCSVKGQVAGELNTEGKSLQVQLISWFSTVCIVTELMLVGSNLLIFLLLVLIIASDTAFGVKMLKIQLLR